MGVAVRAGRSAWYVETKRSPCQSINEERRVYSDEGFCRVGESRHCDGQG